MSQCTEYFDRVKEILKEPMLNLRAIDNDYLLGEKRGRG